MPPVVGESMYINILGLFMVVNYPYYIYSKKLMVRVELDQETIVNTCIKR